MFLLKVGLLASVFVGAIKTARVAWDLGDLGVGIMAWLNIIAILILHKPALRALRDYERQHKAGEEIRFDAQGLGIKDAEFWTDREAMKTREKV